VQQLRLHTLSSLAASKEIEIMPSDQDNPRSPARKLPPEDPAARDEGPRLIPFRERRKKERTLEPDQRYLELADVAIQKRKPSK
jgi:hypothetical protein